MEKIDKMVSFGPKELPVSSILSVDCFDTIEAKARVTFDAETVDGIKITYWMDDDKDIKDRVNKIFDYFFEEVFKVDEIVETK